MIHTMSSDHLFRYCQSKIHSKLILNKHVKNIHIVPNYDRTYAISASEKRDKLFNFKRPTAEIHGNSATLYAFPGHDYVEHYVKIYSHLGYAVTHDTPSFDTTSETVTKLLPSDFPRVDVVILGYVEPLAASAMSEVTWSDSNHDIVWTTRVIGGKLVAFVGVKFSYWGDVIYHVISALSAYTTQVIYIGKLGSLNVTDVPNRTLATGNSSLVANQVISWDNIFATSTIAQSGNHVTVSSVLSETYDWATSVRDTHRWVDPEIGWAAKACQDTGIGFSYLHLVTDNLLSNHAENLTTERKHDVIAKRLEYVNLAKAELWHALGARSVSLETAVAHAQQRRVDRNILKPLIRDWDACLSFAYHTQEEAWEVVRELPRREWKDQVVVSERVLAELADTQIQLLTTMLYAGFTYSDLEEAILTKLGVSRSDWK